MCGRQDEPGALPQKRKSGEEPHTQGFSSGRSNSSSPSPTLPALGGALEVAVPVTSYGTETNRTAP